MPVSPRDFALWASATGNKYPQTPEEKMAAAPHAYDFAKNLGKTGANAPGSRVGGRIVFDQPISAQFADNNSVLHSPVTPDNNVPKVAGTLDNTMTGEHYDNQQRDMREDNARSNNLVRNLGRAALATGVVAGGAILATRPEARQAVRGAIDTAQQQASNIGNRISDFLGGLGVSRSVDNEVIHNTGDVTPPTTSQRYQQEQIPNAMQELQAAKGANVGTPEKATVPTTTASTGVKPITESEIISTSQTFTPRETGFRSAALAEYENAMPATETVQEARRQAATAQLQRAAESIRSSEPYQMEIPGVGATLMALRSKEAGVTPEQAGVYQAPPAPKLGPSTEQYSLLHTTPDPWTGEYTPAVPTYSPSQQTSDLNPTVKEQLDIPARNIGYSGSGRIVHHEEVPAPKLGGRSLVRIQGEGPSRETATVEQQFYPGEMGPAEQRDITGAFLTPKVTRLAGERDIEAAIATREAQGVYPEGRYSSLLSGEEYAPASEIWRQSSTIDPRVVTAGEQSVLGKVQGYLGGKAGWVEQAKQQREIARQERLAEAAPQLAALKMQIEGTPQQRKAAGLEAETDPRALTFLKQVTGLYDITEDPKLLEAAGQRALPLNVTLPGGETVPTKSFFKPFGVVGAGEPSANEFMTTNPTQVQALENIAIGKQTTLNNVKAGILKQFGKEPTDKITNNMFNQLPQAQRQVLMDAHNDWTEATTRLNRAKDMPVLFSIPEEIQQGTKMAPIVSQTTGDVVGMSAVPAEKAVATPELYRMRAAGGAGRQEVGGVGRRRESLESEYGHTRSGSPLDLETVLYRHKDTGEILTGSDVGLAEIAHGSVVPISGETVEPQRIMGKEGRTFKGISADVINRASFDPVERERLLAAFPEAKTPEGLVYAPGALESPGGGARPTLGTRFDKSPAFSRAERETGFWLDPDEQTPLPTPGSAREAKINSLIASSSVAQNVNPQTAYKTRMEKISTRVPTPAEQSFLRAHIHAGIWGDPADLQSNSAAQTIQLEPASATVVTHREFKPTQLVIPGAGVAPQIRSTPALEEAVATEQYMGTRPGKNLRTAMQKALSKAAAYQPSLF
jgi:hypothetical protein